MKYITILTLTAALLCGCSNKQEDARLTALEKAVKELGDKIDALPAPTKSDEQPRATRTRTVSGDLDVPKHRAPLAPKVVSITGRVTEQNNVWWKWAYVLTVANTNDAAIVFDANIQFLDKDGFVVSERMDYDVSVGPMLTNKVAGFDLINVRPASTVKSLKAVTIPK